MSLDFLDLDVTNEIYKNVGSQEVNLILKDFPDGYLNDSFNMNSTSAGIEDESTTPYEDVKNFAISQNVALNPIPLNKVLSNEEYVGPFGFEVHLIPNDLKTKDPWVYSPLLNKVFMDISQSFPVDFKISNRPQDQRLFVRVTPQYSNLNFAQEPVLRCIQHDFAGDSTNRGIPEHVRQHVIRCLNNLADYMGNPKDGQRLSIVFPLGNPQAGSESVREYFNFVCKSSCPVPGMNRREIEVIFTLEDVEGKVVGRKSLKVRVCACPKRDKDKEEKEAEKSAHNAPPKGKKRKVEPPAPPQSRVTVDGEDSTVFNLQMQFVGRDNLLKLLTYGEDLYAAKLHKMKGSSQDVLQPLQDNLERIQTAKKSLMTKHQ